MWAISNRTPFAADRGWVRDKRGAEVWIVAVKATFGVEPGGQLRLAADQEPIHLAPKLRDDGGSLLHDTDVALVKSATDVLVEGDAHAPRQQPATQIKVGLAIANVRKQLCVTGDRVWNNSLAGPALSEPKPFRQMPLTYERAFGGTDTAADSPRKHGWEPRNPVGRGFATMAEHLDGVPAANIEQPAAMITGWKDRPQPAGFGPIAGHWSPRLALAGTYDDHWRKTRLPLLPEDFDDRYYQSAPTDQQVPGHLKGGEPLTATNLTPDGTLRINLPRVALGFTTRFDDGSKEEHRGTLHTVTLHTDGPRLVMLWQSSLECHHKVLKLRHTTVRVKRRLRDPGLDWVE